MNKNPSDIFELLSRGDADPLTSEELAIVDRAIAAEPGLAHERAAYARLDALLGQFAELPAGVDWDGFSEDVSSMIRAEAAADDDGASQIVEHLSRPLPPVDWSAFHTRVSAAVRDEAAQQNAGRTIKWPAAFAWVAPLAAAAMVAIVVWGPFGGVKVDNGSPRTNGTPIAVVEVEFATPIPTGTASVAIAFDETPPETLPEESGAIPGGTVIVNGAWPTLASPVEPQPQIEVDTYYY